MVNNIQNIIYEKRKTITKIIGINDAFEIRIKLARDVISVARIGNKFQDALICFKNNPFNNTSHWKKNDLEDIRI